MSYVYDGHSRHACEEFALCPTHRTPTMTTWIETDAEHFHEMLEVLPPAAMVRGAFLLGEPHDHRSDDGAPRFATYKREGSKFYVLDGYMTIADFRRVFT